MLPCRPCLLQSFRLASLALPGSRMDGPQGGVFVIFDHGLVFLNRSQLKSSW